MFVAVSKVTGQQATFLIHTPCVAHIWVFFLFGEYSDAGYKHCSVILLWSPKVIPHHTQCLSSMKFSQIFSKKKAWDTDRNARWSHILRVITGTQVYYGKTCTEFYSGNFYANCHPGQFYPLILQNIIFMEETANKCLHTLHENSFV